jgi:hypothetical protein
MVKYLPLAAAAIIATQIGCTYLIVRAWRAGLGVQCLDQRHVALQHLNIDRPGYCIAVVPAYLDRD